MQSMRSMAASRRRSWIVFGVSRFSASLIAPAVSLDVVSLVGALRPQGFGCGLGLSPFTYDLRAATCCLEPRLRLLHHSEPVDLDLGRPHRRRSHWPGCACGGPTADDRKASATADEWNRGVLKLIASRDADELLRQLPEYVREAKVNVGFKHSALALGALGGRLGRAGVYAGGPQYGSGVAVIRLL